MSVPTLPIDAKITPVMQMQIISSTSQSLREMLKKQFCQTCTFACIITCINLIALRFIAKALSCRSKTLHILETCISSTYVFEHSN